MQCNVGGVDRWLRIIAGVAICGAGLYFKSWWGLVGLPPLITGLIGWCPAYIPLKLSTRR
jgi:hypothetical protein